MGPNVVVDAELEPRASGALYDPDGRFGYLLHIGSLGHVLSLLASGAFPLRDGRVHGRFSVVNVGGNVTLVPVDPDAPSEADMEAEGAPDLSDLVLSLARAG